MGLTKELTKGLIKENPVFVMILGMCPVLAITTSLENAIGMGLAVTAVVTLSNIVISIFRKLVPDNIRIPVYIVIIASFVTIIELIMKAYAQPIYQSLGIFIPLIVVNCMILGRAEAFASKNKVFPSIFDGIGMGLGYTLAICLISFFRELIGNGTLLGHSVLGAGYQPALVMILPPGAFITFGCLLALANKIQEKRNA